MIIPKFYKPTNRTKRSVEKNVVTYSLADEIPYEEIIDGTILYRNGSMGCCYNLSPLYVDSMTEEARNHMVSMLGASLSTLDLTTYAQFVWRKTNKNMSIVERHLKSVSTPDPLINLITENRGRFWKQMVDREQVFGISTELWVRKGYPRTYGRNFNRMSSLTGIDAQKAIERFKKEHMAIERDFAEVCDRVISPLRDITAVHQATPDEIVHHLWSHFTGSGESPRYDPSIPLRAIFHGVDVSRKWGYLSMGNQTERQVAILSVDLLPSSSYMTMINHILSMPIPLTVVMNVGAVPMDEARQKLRRQLTRYGGLALRRDIEIEEKASEVAYVLEELERSSKVLLDMEMYVIVEAESISTLARRINAVSSSAQGKMDMVTRQEKAALPLAFRASMPGHCVTGTLDRQFRVMSSNVADLAPVLGPVESAQKPVALFRAPYQSLYGYDLFDPRLPAHHGLIFGSTGSGKSFTTNLLLLSMMSQNPSTYIIDQGGSYEKLTRLVGGAYIDFSNPNISINPLSTGGADYETELATKNLIIQEMVREEPGMSVSKEEQIIIERMLQTLYRHFQKKGEEPTLSDAYKIVTDRALYDPEKEGYLAESQRRVALYLQKWTRVGSKGTSPYARILDNPITNVSFSGNFVCFDLLGIKQYPDLMRVVFLTLNGMMGKIIRQDRQRPKIIVFDEVWALLKTDEGSVFIEELYRTMRKYNAMVLSISQDIDDFSNSSVASALLSNTYQMFVLRQSADFNADKIQSVLKLNDSEKMLIANLRQKKGHFSDIFLKISGVGSSKVSLVPSPIEYWMATTDPNDSKLFFDTVSRGANINEALESLAYEYPNGVSAKKVKRTA